jgi:effector-binding domain-containing protein
MSCMRMAAGMALAIGLACGSARAEGPPAEAPPALNQGEPAAPLPLQEGEAFGQQLTLPERTIIYRNGESDWDSAFESIVGAFKSLDGYVAQQGIKPIGPAMVIYTETDDKGFSFRAALPVAEPPKQAPTGDFAVGQSPSGKAIEFVHRGSYDAMDSTYEAINNYLDDKQIEAKDLFIEEYVTDPVTTSQDALVVHVLVPVK